MNIPEQSSEINELIKKSEQGDAEAQFSLGWRYSIGKGVQQNYEEAAKWYLKAAEQDHMYAQNNLGVAYNIGQGVPQNYDEATRWYRKSAEQGNAVAQGNLGRAYEDGKGVQQNYDEALYWYRKGAEQDDPDSLFYLGLMYSNGLGVPTSKEEAAIWYRKAADKGHHGAQNNLGVIYQYGPTGIKNYKEAATWYRKAAKQGNAIAQCNLALMYQNGRGVIKSFKEAIKWFNKAAEKNNARALYNLGLIYLNDSYKGKNKAKAIELFKRICNDPEYGSKSIEQIDKIERETISSEITEIRRQLLSKLIADTNKQPTMTHYTSLSVGNRLLKEKSPLRLGHLNAVNDPNEGKLLWRAIGHEPIEANPVFVGCFLPDSDSLNMWRFYSKNHLNDDACGCAITFNINDFFDYRLLNKTTEKADHNKYTSYNNEDSGSDESAAFYRVIYIDKNGYPVNDVKCELYNIIDKLTRAAKAFIGDSPTNEKYQSLAKLLGPIPYLIKDSDYKDEQEHRIIITHLSYGAEEIKAIDPDLEHNIPPKLYLELHRDNHLKPINYVTLGPKAPYKEMMAPYWHHQLAIKYSQELNERPDDREKFHIRASRCAYK
ncbi:tetratricopeptide repeat protein [Aeromonas hydrophila]